MAYLWFPISSVIASVSLEETATLKVENTKNSIGRTMAIQRGEPIIKSLFLFEGILELLEFQHLLSLSRT